MARIFSYTSFSLGKLNLNPYLMATMGTWGLNFVAIKLLYTEMHAGAVALVRFFVMWVVLLAACLVLRIPLRYPKGHSLKILLQGFLAMGFYMVCFFHGMEGSTPAEGAILLGTAPIFTLIVAVLVRQEKFVPRAVPGVLLAFVGVILVVGAQGGIGGGHYEANMTVLKSAIIWAFGTVLSRSIVAAKVHPLALLTLSMPGALIALMPYGWKETFLQPWWQNLDFLGWSMIAYVAIVAGVLGFYWFYQGVREVGASHAMLYQYFVAPLAALSGWLFLGIPLVPLQILGMFVVVGGVALANAARKPSPVITPAAVESS